MLRETDVLVRSSAPVTAAADDELVMLDASQGAYFGLNSVGRRVWELLEQPTEVATLCARLEQEFDVPADTCLSDVLTFLEQMRRDRLLVVEAAS